VGKGGEREDGPDDHPNALFTHSFQNVGLCVLLGWMSCEFLVDQACLWPSRTQKNSPGSACHIIDGREACPFL